MRLHRFRGDGDKRPREIPWRRWLVLCLFVGTGTVSVGVLTLWPATAAVVGVVVAVVVAIIGYWFPPPADGLSTILR